MLLTLRSAFEDLGTCIFGKRFGFLEKTEDHAGYINAFQTARPFLNIVAVAPTYLRPLIRSITLLIPNLFKASMTFDGFRVLSLGELDNSTLKVQEECSKRNDFISQFLSIMQDRGDKVGFTVKEVNSEAWVAL